MDSLPGHLEGISLEGPNRVVSSHSLINLQILLLSGNSCLLTIFFFKVQDGKAVFNHSVPIAERIQFTLASAIGSC